MLKFGIDLPRNKDFDRSPVPNDTIATAIGLFVKASLTYRSILLACEFGLDQSCLPLNRSLFENLVNLTFLVRRRVNLYHFNPGTKTPLNLLGQKLTSSFRTALYNAFCILRDDNIYTHWEWTPGLARHAKTIKVKRRIVPRDYIDDIGPAWQKRIAKANTCVGLSIADFAASLGPTFRTWHRTVYAAESQTVHQSDVPNYLDYAPDTGDICPMWHSSPEEIDSVISRSVTMYWQCLYELHKRFSFGPDADRKFNEYASMVIAWGNE